MVLLTMARRSATPTLGQIKAVHFGKKLLLDKDHIKDLPEAYKNFYREWKWQKPSPLYYIPEEAKYKFNEKTGNAVRVVNVPIPTKWVPEFDNMLMGGEAIVKGFTKKKMNTRRIPHWWVPTLRQTVVYSEILDSYMPVVVTKTLIDLVHKHKGFDNYILQTPACELVSQLALKIKRKILLALASGDCYPNDEVKRKQILQRYQKFIILVEEAEWYGLTLKEASIKNHLANKVEPAPMKHLYRKELIEYLKENDGKEEKRPSNDSLLSRISKFLPK